MFVVEVGAALTTVTAIVRPSVFNWTIVVWLWLTVLFANLAEAVAEGRGKAQARHAPDQAGDRGTAPGQLAAA